MALDVELSYQLRQILTDNNFPVAVIEKLRVLQAVDVAYLAGLGANAQGLDTILTRRLEYLTRWGVSYLLKMEGATPEAILRSRQVAVCWPQPSLDDHSANLD